MKNCQKKLAELRKEIDKIDDELFNILKKRENSAKKILIWKKRRGIELIDSEREIRIIKRISQKDFFSEGFATRLFNVIFSESHKIVENLK